MSNLFVVGQSHGWTWTVDGAMTTDVYKDPTPTNAAPALARRP